jgi:hypothetical protein
MEKSGGVYTTQLKTSGVHLLVLANIEQSLIVSLLLIVGRMV